MSWCEFDNWSSSGLDFDQRLMTKSCSGITLRISKLGIFETTGSEHSTLSPVFQDRRTLVEFLVIQRPSSTKDHPIPCFLIRKNTMMDANLMSYQHIKH